MKAFIYDMDGVIADTEPVHTKAERIVLQDMGIEVTDEFLAQYQGVTDLMMYEDLKEKFHFAPSAAEVAKKKAALFQKIMREEHVTPIEGILALIEKTHERRKTGLKTAIASSSNRAFISFVVDDLGIRDKFDFLMSGESVPRSKPDPAVYLQTAGHLGVAPADCVVIEDTKSGALAAKAAGMRCIGFKSPHSFHPDLSMCDAVVTRIADVDLSEW